MVTKRTGRPRGRPRKPVKPRARVGRPSLTLRKDPDRYAIGCLDAMLALGLASERACGIALAAILIGVESTGARPSADSRHVLTRWELFRTQTGSTAGTLEGLAVTLRMKRRRYRSTSDIRFRTAMGAAFQAVFAIPDMQMAKQVSLAAAASIDEAEFAHRVLGPMIHARFSGQFRIQDGALEIV
jgi:hypothetical protein